MDRLFYIAGQMTGLPDFNYPAFHRAEAVLNSLGFKCFNPARIANGDTTLSYPYYIKEGIKGLIECTDILFLSRWSESGGAKMEAHIAKKLELPGWKLRGDKLEELQYTIESYSL